MITEKDFQELGLVSYETGYYQINEEVTVDVEGDIRIENDYTTRSLWIANVRTVDQLKVFIECIN